MIRELVSSVVSLAQLVSPSVALLAKLVLLISLYIYAVTKELSDIVQNSRESLVVNDNCENPT